MYTYILNTYCTFAILILYLKFKDLRTYMFLHNLKLESKKASSSLQNLKLFEK